MNDYMSLFNRVIIDLSEDYIRIIEGRIFRNKLKIKNQIYIESYSNDELEQIFLNIQNKINIKGIRSKNTNLILDNDIFLYEKIKIPFVKEKDILNIVKNRYMDSEFLNKNHYNLQYIDCGYNKRINQKEIMVIGIKKDMAKIYWNLCKDIGLKAKKLHIRANTINKYYKYMENINNKYKFSNINILDLCLNKRKTEITIFKKGIMNFINTIDIDFTYEYEEQIVNNKNIDRIILESSIHKKLDDLVNIIKINIDIFKRENDENINLINLSGDLSLVNGIDNYMSKSLNLHTIISKETNGERSTIGSMYNLKSTGVNYEY